MYWSPPMHLICNVERTSSALGHCDLALLGGLKVPYDIFETRMLKNLSDSEGHPVSRRRFGISDTIKRGS